MLAQHYLDSSIKQMEYYRQLGEKAIAQVPDEGLFLMHNEDSNSIATVVRHLSGNMLSRWTDFLTTDGEKPWRNRDAEFATDSCTRAELMEQWEKGWNVFIGTLKSLQPEDLERIIYIRNEGHTVMEAIHRQLTHYSYHVGQIVFLSKMYAHQWTSLSIPRGGSQQYNAKKFSEEKGIRHFTKDWMTHNEGEGEE